MHSGAFVILLVDVVLCGQAVEHDDAVFSNLFVAVLVS